MAVYGIELRERVLRAWDSGESQEDVALRFEVSVRWIQKIARQRRETGSLAPQPASGGGVRLPDSSTANLCAAVQPAGSGWASQAHTCHCSSR